MWRDSLNRRKRFACNHIPEDFLKYQFSSPDYDDVLKPTVFSRDSDREDTAIAIIPVTDSARYGNFPICLVDLRGDPGAEFLISIQMDGYDFFSEKTVLGIEGSMSKIMRHPDPESIVDEQTCGCMVCVTDSTGRDLCRSEFSVRFHCPPKHIRLWAHVDFNGLPKKGDGVVRLANLRLRSVGIESSFVINAFISNYKLLSRTVTVPKDGSVRKVLELDERSYLMASEHVLRVEVRSEYGAVLSDRSIVIDSDFFSGTGSSPDDIRYSEYSRMTDKPIHASCLVSENVDVHASYDDNKSVGTVTVNNESPSEQTVSLHIMFEGDFVFRGNFDICRGEKVLDLPIPSNYLYREDPFKADLECQVYDSEGFLILHCNSTVTIRSMFDMDLSRVEELTAQFVNPLDPVIKDMVVRADGIMAKTMKRDFRIFDIRGYQYWWSPCILMMTAYNALRDVLMYYVSDICTLPGPGHYQRVRTPSKVLEDRSGNCLELSILFATIFEVMGLEPVVVFLPGHAVVGVVTSTNKYHTRSNNRRYKFCCQKPIRFDIDDDHYFEAVFLETTMCTCRDYSFNDAVKFAHDKINSNPLVGYSLVSEHRDNDVGPDML